MTTKARTIIEQGIKVIDKITVFFGIFSGILGIVLCILVFSSVILRYFFHSPIAWSDEISAYIYVYQSILAIAFATYLESHVSAELLNDKFPPTVQFLVSMFGYIAMMICIAIIFYYGSKTTQLYYLRGWRSATDHEVLLWPIMAVIPIGFGLFFVQCISRVYVAIMRFHLNDPTAYQPKKS